VSTPLRILPVGDAALTVELGRALDPAVNARVRALDDALRARPFPGLRESVPAFASLLAVYDPARCSFADARAHLDDLRDGAASAPPARALHVLPTAYGGAHGPDLAEVARRCRLSEAEVIARHCAAEYTAFFVGFLPGFAYLGPVAPELEMPRRASPRARVPAGSVAVAGPLTGVYPFASPGGWNLIGRTARVLFDPLAETPALIRPGDRVRFTVSEAALDAGARPGPRIAPASTAVLEVLEGGLLTTVQDEGRRGHRRLGVPWCGALDGDAARAANRALGNPLGAATLECTASGPSLRFLTTTRFAVAGADLGAVLERADLGPWPVPRGRPVVARAGNVLSMRDRRAGMRAYVAVADGIDVPAVLGSRATDLTAGFGGLDGRALRAGDLLCQGRTSPPAAEAPDADTPSPPAAPLVVRVVAGPQDDMFEDEARARLEDETYEIGPLSDRTGCRLVGPALPHRGRGEILTDGMVPGCIQVPPDGQPIILMGDGPTTGGYPKIATVVTADLGRLGQLASGDRLRFRVVTVEEAQRTARARIS
jgi:KipI family sensor histidine kinase inhibitor